MWWNVCVIPHRWALLYWFGERDSRGDWSGVVAVLGLVIEWGIGPRR